MDNIMQGLVDSSKTLGLLTHEKKSDDELREIISSNQRFIMAMPVYNATNETLIEQAKKLGEMKACTEILEKREAERKKAEKTRKNILKAKKEWSMGLTSRRSEAVLKLPVATSYKGQLVAAILESQDNQTAEEIAQWDEELCSLGSEELKKILDALVDEQILIYDEDNKKYSLLSICTETLFPIDPIRWATRKLEVHQEKICKEHEEIILAIQNAGVPLTVNDIKETHGSVWYEIPMLVTCGVLKKYKCPKENVDMYYFTMLGED